MTAHRGSIFCPGVLIHTCSQPPLQHDRAGTGTKTIPTAEYKPVKAASAAEQRMHYCSMLRGF